MPVDVSLGMCTCVLPIFTLVTNLSDNLFIEMPRKWKCSPFFSFNCEFNCRFFVIELPEKTIKLMLQIFHSKEMYIASQDVFHDFMYGLNMVFSLKMFIQISTKGPEIEFPVGVLVIYLSINPTINHLKMCFQANC